MLLDEPYYVMPPPKSTGKELFNLGYVETALAGREIGGDDLVATLTVLTAESVARALIGCRVTEVVAAGGGTRNPVLMSALHKRLAGVRFRPLEEFGVPEACKEALAFALIGYLTGCRLKASVSCPWTGARHVSLLGSITPGAEPLPIVSGLEAPARLLSCMGPRRSRPGDEPPVTDSPVLSLRNVRVGSRRRHEVREIVRGVDLDVLAGERLRSGGERIGQDADDAVGAAAPPETARSARGPDPFRGPEPDRARRTGHGGGSRGRTRWSIRTR